MQSTTAEHRMRKSTCGQPKGQLHNHSLGCLMSHKSSMEIKGSRVFSAVDSILKNSYKTTDKASKPWRIVKTKVSPEK